MGKSHESKTEKLNMILNREQYRIMKIARTVKDLHDLMKAAESADRKIGFVPTMGALHKGHADLVRRCVSENHLSVCSLFVNPTQFNNPDDLKNYPRTEQQDLRLLESLFCDVVFIPSVEEMYPEHNLINLDFGILENVMEGKFRPGHFRGVATVVEKLFRMVNPYKAYFGEKDYQQLLVIQELVSRLNLKVRIVPCQTVREPDGLAMSSRNVHLSEVERKQAPVIYNTLRLAASRFLNQEKVEDIYDEAVKRIEENKLFKVEYFQILLIQTGRKPLLQLIQEYTNTENIRIFTAVKASNVRLIDNIPVPKSAVL